MLYFGGYNATTKEHFGDMFIVNTSGERERERELEDERN